MNGTNGNEPGYPENALVPYPVIVAATKGDPDAMKIVLQHFSGYIARLSMRKLYDERGNVYFGVDHDIRERLQAKLMMAVLTFKGSVTFTVIGNSNSIVWRLYFYFQGEKYRCTGRNFFNWFPAVL